nr:hypothetical protein CFP56_53701 [Quercus suber]
MSNGKVDKVTNVAVVLVEMSSQQLPMYHSVPRSGQERYARTSESRCSSLRKYVAVIVRKVIDIIHQQEGDSHARMAKIVQSLDTNCLDFHAS